MPAIKYKDKLFNKETVTNWKYYKKYYGIFIL